MKPKELSIGAAKELFLYHQHSKGLAEKTLSNAESAIDIFLAYTGLKTDDYVSIISKDWVNSFTESLRNSTLSLASQNLWLSHFRVFLYWLMEEELISQFKVKLIKGQREKVKFFTDQEVELLLKKPDKHSSYSEDRTYVIVCFIMATGARANTIINLRREDVDYSSKTITYTHLKNKRTAIIPLTGSLESVLKWFDNRYEITSEYMFPSVNNTQMTLGALEQSFRKYCIKRGVKPRGPHSARHSFARMYIKNGGDAFSLQQILTHSSMEMTKRYVALFSDDLRASMQDYIPLEKHRSERIRIVGRGS